MKSAAISLLTGDGRAGGDGEAGIPALEKVWD